jgi:hypothetical protein
MTALRFHTSSPCRTLHPKQCVEARRRHIYGPIIGLEYDRPSLWKRLVASLAERRVGRG